MSKTSILQCTLTKQAFGKLNKLVLDRQQSITKHYSYLLNVMINLTSQVFS